MSAVWRVRRDGEPHGEIFALKTLRYGKSTTSTAYQRFEREIEILTALKNRAGIVAVVDHAQRADGEDGELYYTMPWA